MTLRLVPAWFRQSPDGLLWNVTANPGAGGAIFASDDGGGVTTPKNKLQFGADGTKTDVSATNPLPVQDTPATSGGLSSSDLISAASTNATLVKNAAGQVYGVLVSVASGAAAQCCVKLYDKATAPTVGTDTPKRTVIVQPGQSVYLPFSKGLVFAAGIGFAITRNPAAADATAVALNDCSVGVDYK